MRIYKTINIGEFHTNHCEDYLIEEQIATNEKLIAVLDGCTMGTESVFASILYGKILSLLSKKEKDIFQKGIYLFFDYNLRL